MMGMIGFLSMLIIGLLVGAVAKFFMPGKDPGGVIVTMLIGVVGAFIGGIVGSALLGRGVNGFNVGSLLLAIAGAFLLLVVYRAVTRRTVAGGGSP